MRIDLHTHSSASDGTEPPAGVIGAAAEAGLDVVALTDHDTTEGWAEAAEAARRLGLTFVPGAELSCVGRTAVHLLAYLFDPDDAELAREMAWARDDRVPRAEEIVRRLAADGYPVTLEAVLAHAPDAATLGRPHIADALVAAGAFADRNEAFEQVLHDGSPYYVGHYAVDPHRAVALVRAAGGVPVLAHPRGRKGVPDELVAALAAEGLAGIEVDHPEHSASDRRALRALAADLGLLTTGSSDYHGTGKPTPIGAETTDPEVFDRLVAQARGATAVVVP